MISLEIQKKETNIEIGRYNKIDEFPNTCMKTTDNRPIHVKIAITSRLAIANLRYNRYCQSTSDNSDFNVNRLIPIDCQ